MNNRSGGVKRLSTFFCICLICLGSLLPRQFALAQSRQEQRTFLPVVAKNTGTLAGQPGWLAAVNAFRASAGLPPVTENPTWSAADVQHARYTVKTARPGHSEDPSSPWYTAAGQQAARNSNVFATTEAGASETAVIQSWMLGPFHAAGILDPRLKQVGFGSYREPGSLVQMAAALNVLSGLDFSAPVKYPVIWPANGKSVSMSRYSGNEYPDPLTSCPGYQAPSGLPLIVQLGPGSVTPQISAISFTRDGQPLEACVFDETSYTNPDPTAQALGRKALNMRDTVVLIPRLPLEPGATYSASITSRGQTISWSFSISPQPAAPPFIP